MIRHIVLIKFRDEVSEQEIAAAFRQIASLQSVVDGIRSITSGKSESPEKIERGYMHGFVADFRDWAALAAYQEHPDHKRAGAELVRLAEGGLDGILVFDLPVEDLPGAAIASFNS
jgi:hypothetical protein